MYHACKQQHQHWQQQQQQQQASSYYMTSFQRWLACCVQQAKEMALSVHTLECVSLVELVVGMQTANSCAGGYSRAAL